MADAQALESQIDAVTVFTRGALITRHAELKPTRGAFPDAVRITGLPLTADDSSFRARIEGADGSARAGLPVARDLRIALEAPAIAEGPDADEAALREARREQARLTALVAQLQAELKTLSALKLPGRPKGKEGEPPPRSPTEARLALVDFVAQRSETLTEELLALGERAKRASERRAELEDEVRRSSTDRRAEAHALRKSAVIALEGRGEGTAPARLVLEYQVPGARWAPGYAVRLHDGDAELAMRAVVAQRTGEDWKGVRLTLSTADAQRWAELPELHSLRIGRRQHAPARPGWRPPPTGAEALYGDWDRAFAERLRAERKARDAREAARRPTAAPMMADDMGDQEVSLSVAFEEQAPYGGGLPDLAAAAAPPPMAAAPAPMPAAADEITGAIPRPSASLIRASRNVPRSARRKGAAARQAAPPPAPPPRELRARDDMLAYGSLRMPASDSRERGRLVVTDRVQLYLELLVEQRIDVELDVAPVVDKAIQRADSAGATLPPRHRLASSDDGYAYAYVAETRIEVPSDRHYHSIPLLARTAPARQRHVSVPRESSDVFRIAEVENPLPGPLLPGPADVYLGDVFLVTSDVPATPPGAQLELGLGVDQSVKVSRNTSYREETKGLTRGSLALEHEIAIEARNNRDRAVELELRERIPSTQKHDDEVTVEPPEAEPPWQSWEPEPRSGTEPLRGGHRWLVTLAPGEQKTLRARYRIKISSRHELVGGNRRES